MPIWRRRDPVPPAPPRVRWGAELDDAALRTAGRATYELLVNSELWIHRRVDRIAFKDYSSAIHQTSVDFTLPVPLAQVAQDRGEAIYVAPLFLLLKDARALLGDDSRTMPVAPYTCIDLTDETGRSLPLLTRRQRTQIAAVALLRAAGRANKAAIPPGTLRTRIADIATSDSTRDAPALDYVMHQPTCENDIRETLRDDPTFRELAFMLARFSPVICLFNDKPSDRCIVKLRYHEETNTGIARAGGRIRRSLGWKSQQFFVAIPTIGACSSYHVEVDVPQELELTELGLVGTRYELADHDISAISSGKDYYIRQTEKRLWPQSFNIPNSIYVPSAHVPRHGAAWVKLRARREGFLRGALVASLATTLVLTFAAANAIAITHAESPGNGKSDATTALLLLLPTILAAYVVRPGEHAITGKTLRFARLALTIDGALPFIAAARLLTYSDTTVKHVTRRVGAHLVHTSIVVPSNPHGLQVLWIVLASVSAVFALLFCLSYYLPRPHAKPQYVVPPPKR